MMVGYGNASGKPDPVDGMELANHGSLFLTRPTLCSCIRERAELLASAAAYFDVLTTGIAKIRLGKQFDLADAAGAHHHLTDRNRIGAPLLIP